MKELRVNAGKGYNLLIGSGLLEDAGELIRPLTKAKSAVIVADDIVNGLYADKTARSLEKAGFSVSVFVFKNGEPSKSHPTLINLYEFLSGEYITRSDILVSLGGGVTGDLTGYAAATYLRGLDFVQIPTTVLAQTDSSVGGKTGVNIASGKNLVGSFHQPLLVICDTATLKTLPPDVYSDGMAEIIKHGMIYDSELFNMVDGGFDDIEGVLEKSVSVKIKVVEKDVLDKGERMKLNFGHTVGHAIERYHNYRTITHGSAVSIGMSLITKYSEKSGLTQKGTYEKLTACLEKYNLPVKTDANISELYSYSMHDKKRSGDRISIILCDKIGSSFIKTVTSEEFRELLRDTV